MRLAIDPGHPTHEGDTGSQAPGLLEYEYSWHMVTSWAAYLRRTVLGVDSFLLRSAVDEVVSLEERGRRSRDGGADLVVSLHVDASESKTLRCASGYYWPSNLTGQQVVQTVIRCMPHPLFRKMGYGAFAARQCARDQWLQRSRNVIEQHAATAVLIELGFCTNETDLTALLDPTTQTGIILALTAGVLRFQQLTGEYNGTKA